MSKLAIVEEEADECIYWLELMSEGNLIETERIAALLKEANELLSITVASIKTARKRKK